MTSTKFSPLHLEAPRLVADAALGEHLAALARASAPSAASRVRRSGWRVPLAAVATIAATGGVAYAGQAALSNHAKTPSAPVQANAFLLQAAADAARATTLSALASIEHAPNPHGKIVGRGHPKTGKANGHPGVHDAGNHGSNNPNKVVTPIAHLTFTLWRKSVGSAGVSSP